MSDPVFLTAAQVEAYHARGLELYGGSEGLRNRSLFEGAVAQAQNVYWYANGDLYDIAAAYCSTSHKLKRSLMGIKGLPWLRVWPS